ncbi:hypothetical protein BX666DRAFT_1995315 [Dichotomocladium elegans]|nr:hypothetical protein BX666DRAFT_1995315 [Dichotomocladium elegans]
MWWAKFFLGEKWQAKKLSRLDSVVVNRNFDGWSPQQWWLPEKILVDDKRG